MILSGSLVWKPTQSHSLSVQLHSVHHQRKSLQNELHCRPETQTSLVLAKGESWVFEVIGFEWSALHFPDERSSRDRKLFNPSQAYFQALRCGNAKGTFSWQWPIHQSPHLLATLSLLRLSLSLSPSSSFFFLSILLTLSRRSLVLVNQDQSQDRASPVADTLPALPHQAVLPVHRLRQGHRQLPGRVPAGDQRLGWSSKWENLPNINHIYPNKLALTYLLVRLGTCHGPCRTLHTGICAQPAGQPWIVTVMLTGVKGCHQTSKLTRRLGGGTTRWKEQNSSILHNITLIRHTST